jgi:hypothetical protein
MRFAAHKAIGMSGIYFLAEVLSLTAHFLDGSPKATQ